MFLCERKYTMKYQLPPGAKNDHLNEPGHINFVQNTNLSFRPVQYCAWKLPIFNKKPHLKSETYFRENIFSKQCYRLFL